MPMIDPPKFKVAKTVRVKGITLCTAHVPGTERLLIGGADFQVRSVDFASAKPEAVAFTGETHQSYVTGAALIPANPPVSVPTATPTNQDELSVSAETQVANRTRATLVTGGYDGRLIWWDVDRGESVRSVQGHERWIRNVIPSPDGRFVASIADDMICRVWDAATGEKRLEFTGHAAMTPHHFPSMLFAVAYSPDGQFLATGDKVGHIVVWEVATGAKAAELEAPIMYTWDPKQRRHSIGGIRSLAFSPDGRMLAAGGIGTIGNIDHLDGPSRIEIFDWAAKTRAHEISDTKFKGLVEQLTYTANGTILIAAGGDNGGFVSFFDAATGKVIHQDKAPMHVHRTQLDERSARLYAVGHEQLTAIDIG